MNETRRIFMRLCNILMRKGKTLGFVVAHEYQRRPDGVVTMTMVLRPTGESIVGDGFDRVVHARSRRV